MSRSAENGAQFALVANHNGHGVVLAAHGMQIEHELSEVGHALDELGLDAAPNGVSVWVGHFVAKTTAGRIDIDSNYLCAVGAFSPPTEEEWGALQFGMSPWGGPL